MAEAIRFFFDEHFPFPVVEGLRRRGVDVLTVQEAGRCGLPDINQLEFASTQGRAIVTFDRDYLALNLAGIANSGIVWCPSNKYSISQLISGLLLVHGVLSPDEMRDHVEFL